MKKKKTFVYYKNKKISLEAHECTFFEKGIGLMFSRKENARVLEFAFDNDVLMGIHSYFVFFDFLAVWVDSRDRVIQVDRVKPWVRFLRPKKEYRRLIEIPINKKNMDLVKQFM